MSHQTRAEHFAQIQPPPSPDLDLLQPPLPIINESCDVLPVSRFRINQSMTSWSLVTDKPTNHVTADFTVMVKNIPPDVTEEEISDHFSTVLNRKVVEVSRERSDFRRPNHQQSLSVPISGQIEKGKFRVSTACRVNLAAENRTRPPPPNLFRLWRDTLRRKILQVSEGLSLRLWPKY